MTENATPKTAVPEPLLPQKALHLLEQGYRKQDPRICLYQGAVFGSGIICVFCHYNDNSQQGWYDFVVNKAGVAPSLGLEMIAPTGGFSELGLGLIKSGVRAEKPNYSELFAQAKTLLEGLEGLPLKWLKKPEPIAPFDWKAYEKQEAEKAAKTKPVTRAELKAFLDAHKAHIGRGERMKITALATLKFKKGELPIENLGDVLGAQWISSFKSGRESGFTDFLEAEPAQTINFDEPPKAQSKKI